MTRATRIIPVWRSAIALLLAALCLFAIQPAQAQSFPKLTGQVVDDANLLDPAQEAALTQKLAALETQTNRQMVVVTLPDLQGYDIADYGYQLGRKWGIGQAADGDAEKDNGVLLIVAPNERKVRIEVGYGLEGVMTDALSNTIIQQDILPRFRDNDYPGGIDAGTDAILSQLALPEDEARAYAAQVEQQARKKSKGGNWGAAIFWIFILLFFVLPAIFSSRRGGRRYGAGGVGPIVIWGGGSDGGFGGGGGWGGGSGGGFSGGGGSFGGGGASGGW